MERLARTAYAYPDQAAPAFPRRGSIWRSSHAAECRASIGAHDDRLHGCYAINALLARHIVRPNRTPGPSAQSELCSLHLKETANLDQILSFLIFGDGCAAALVTADPTGFAMDSFRALLVPDTEALITWAIGDSGFNMVLSGQVPGTILDAVREKSGQISKARQFPRSIFGPCIRRALRSRCDRARARSQKRSALGRRGRLARRFGNMSWATVMFVPKPCLPPKDGALGLRHVVRPRADRRDDAVQRGPEQARGEIHENNEPAPQRRTRMAGRIAAGRSARGPWSRRDLKRVNRWMLQARDHDPVCWRGLRWAGPTHACGTWRRETRTFMLSVARAIGAALARRG